MLVAMIIQAVSAPSILSVGVGVCASAGVAVPAAAIAAAISRRQVTQPTARVIIGVIIRVIINVIIDSHVIMMLVPVAWTCSPARFVRAARSFRKSALRSRE